jgi:hypothetical protein
VTRRLVLCILSAAVIAACGSTTGGGGAAPSSSSSEAAAAGGEANGGGGEAALTPFVSTRNHYRVDAPGPMTEAADGTATSTHGAESMTVAIVSGSAAGDPTAYAKSDLTKLKSAPSFALMGGPGGISLTGSPASVQTTYSTATTNTVTGKSQSTVSVRFYIPRDAGTMAVVTYSIIADQFDPQGAVDVANTFRWQ